MLFYVNDNDNDNDNDNGDNNNNNNKKIRKLSYRLRLPRENVILSYIKSKYRR